MAKRTPNVLEGKLQPKQTPQEANASLLVAGLAPNAAVAREWSGYPFGKVEKTVDLTSTLNCIVDAAERVNAGDLGDVEALLTAQTVTLNAVFVNLAYKASKTRLMDHFESYLKLALKAQSQCRTTCEALAELKTPPIFTKQANIAAQQVVNNGMMVAGSRVRESQTAQNEVMEAYGERVDGGTATAAGGGDRRNTQPDPEHWKARPGRRETPTEAAKEPYNANSVGYWRSSQLKWTPEAPAEVSLRAKGDRPCGPKNAPPQLRSRLARRRSPRSAGQFSRRWRFGEPQDAGRRANRPCITYAPLAPRRWFSLLEPWR